MGLQGLRKHLSQRTIPLLQVPQTALVLMLGPKQWLAECRQADAALCELVDLALLFGERAIPLLQVPQTALVLMLSAPRSPAPVPALRSAPDPVPALQRKNTAHPAPRTPSAQLFPALCIPAEVESSVAKDAFEALAARVQGISYARMAAKKDDSVSAEKRELVKAMRERVKSLLGTLSEKYFASGPKQWLAECRQDSSIRISTNCSRYSSAVSDGTICPFSSSFNRIYLTGLW